MLPSHASQAVAGKHVSSRVKNGPKTNAHKMISMIALNVLYIFGGLLVACIARHL